MTTNTKKKELDTGKVVKNLSKRKLNKTEEKVLALGMNYEITTKLPLHEIITSIEYTVRKLNQKRRKIKS